MRIAVVDLASKEGGALTITKSLFDYISEGNASQHEWHFIIANDAIPESPNLKITRFPKALNGYISRAVTEFFDVNKTLKQNYTECVICMTNMCVPRCNIPQFVYLHQPVPFQKVKRFSFLKKHEKKGAFRQYIHGPIIKRSIKKAKAVFVQTQWMKDAVLDSVGKINIIKIGYPPLKTVQKTDNSNVKLSKDFFYPCIPMVYKNIPIIVKAASVLRNNGYSFKFYVTLTEEELKSFGKTNSIDHEVFVCLGRCSFETVQDIYQKTTLVFPSYIETLGLPLVEARVAGTWIVASDCPFSHEILEGYPNKNFFDPFNPDDLADKMKSVLDGAVHLQNSGECLHIQNNCWEQMMASIEEILLPDEIS